MIKPDDSIATATGALTLQFGRQKGRRGAEVTIRVTQDMMEITNKD